MNKTLMKNFLQHVESTVLEQSLTVSRSSNTNGAKIL